MSTQPIPGSRLDTPPPMPPGMTRRIDQTAPAGTQMTPGMDAGSQNTLPQSIIQWGSSAEDALTAITKAAPDLTAPLAGVIDQIRKIVGGYLQSGGSAPQSNAPQGLAGILAAAGAQSGGAPPTAGGTPIA